LSKTAQSKRHACLLPGVNYLTQEFASEMLFKINPGTNIGLEIFW
jgi:hypothetical protein